MKYQKLHKKVTYICAGLVPVGFIIGGISEISDQTEKAASFFFLLGSVFMFTYCLCRIEAGRISLFSYSDELYKDKEPILFWSFITTIMLGSVVLVPVLLYRVFA